MPRRPAAPVRFRRRPGRSGGWRATMVMLPLAAFTAVFLWDGLPMGRAVPLDAPAAAGADRETARFARCGGRGGAGSSARGGNTCVIDGDTFRYRGETIRIADINTPEVSRPGCAREAALGARATDRLTALLNQGAFTLEPNRDGTGRDRDRYGRALRVVTRGGESLGAVLVREGLAEEWQGDRRGWC